MSLKRIGQMTYQQYYDYLREQRAAEALEASRQDGLRTAQAFIESGKAKPAAERRSEVK